MSQSRLDGHEAEHGQDVQAQLCAYNTAFAELGLRFRWDARTLASLANDGELLEPGLVDVWDWRPDSEVVVNPSDFLTVLAGV